MNAAAVIRFAVPPDACTLMRAEPTSRRGSHTGCRRSTVDHSETPHPDRSAPPFDQQASRLQKLPDI
nr:unnamed protein product [Spirometra erinaceieuropaei]